MKFEEKLMQLRKEKKISQEELGNELNVTRQTISKWELGQSKPDMGKLIEISRFFNVDVNTLTDEFSEINNDNIMTGGVDNTDDFLNSSSQYNSNYYNQDKKSNIKEILLIVLIGIVIIVLLGVAINWVVEKVKDAKAEKEAKELYEEVVDYKDKIFEEHEKITNTIIDSYNENANEMINDVEKENTNEVNNIVEETVTETFDEVKTEVSTNSNDSNSSSTTTSKNSSTSTSSSSSSQTSSGSSSSSINSDFEEAHKKYEEHAQQVEEMQEEMYKQLEEMKANREEIEKMIEVTW